MTKRDSNETSGTKRNAAASPPGSVTTSDKNDLGHQHAAESGTVSLGDEASQSGKSSPGGVEGTGGAS